MKKLMILSCMLLTVSLAWSQEVETKPEFKGEVSREVNALKLASDLVKYGCQQQSALPLIQALQIISETPTKPLDATREGDAVDTSNKEGKGDATPINFDEVLAKAKEFAADDEVMLDLIAQVAESRTAHRGAVGGATRTVETVKANSADRYQISFRAGELAEILVSGDGDTDLDLYVYDSSGNLIARDTDYTDDCYVSWVPAWTGRFTVRIVNRGGVYNRYIMLTN